MQATFSKSTEVSRDAAGDMNGEDDFIEWVTSSPPSTRRSIAHEWQGMVGYKNKYFQLETFGVLRSWSNAKGQIIFSEKTKSESAVDVHGKKDKDASADSMSKMCQEARRGGAQLQLGFQ